MNQKRIFPLLFLLFTLFSVTYAQMNYWTLPPKIYNIMTPGLTNLPGSSSSPYMTSNGAFDQSGNLLFYVISSGNTGLQVYNAAGVGVGSLNGLPYVCNTPNSTIYHNQQEIAIVPVPGACKQYYVIWWYTNPVLTGQTLGYAKIDASAGITIAQQSTSLGCNAGNSAAIAVTKPINGVRYLLSIANSTLRRHTISSSGIGSGITMATGLPFNANINEMEVNPNANRILYGDVMNGNCYVLSVNVAAGTYAGIATYTIPSNHRPKGVEFNASGNMFYACTAGGLYWASTGSGGTMTAIANSSNYTNSHIEMGKDGYLYVVSNSGALAKMHPTTMVITPLASPSVSVYSNLMNPITGQTNYRLPDQIDGDLYDLAPCGVSITASQSLLSTSCVPVNLVGGCASGQCMRMRICVNVKNTGNCVVNAGGTVVISLDPRLKVCNAASTASANLVGVFGGSNPTGCAGGGCCAYSANTNMGSVAVYNLTTSINPNTTVQICLDVQSTANVVNLCTNPFITTAAVSGTCSNGNSYSQSSPITYQCCPNWWNPNNATAMRVSPMGCTAEGYISPNETLTYTISTQDAGTPVQSVMVHLDPKLDLSTLAFTSISEDTRVNISEDQVVEIFFDRGEGEASFEIKPLAGLEDGMKIQGTFDTDLGNGTPATTQDCPTRKISSTESISIADMPASYYAPGCSQAITIEPSVSGGTPDYAFEWSTGETESSITVAPDNSTGYAVRVIDANGCESSWKSTAVFVGPFAIHASEDQTVGPDLVGGECTEIGLVSVEGGTAPFTYLWPDGSDLATLTVCPDYDQTYLLKVTDANGCNASDDVTVYAYTGARIVGRPEVKSVTAFAELTAIPNPFAESSILRFQMPTTGLTKLVVYDQLGREVAVLFDGLATAAQSHEVEFKPAGVGSGIYFARLTDAQGHSQTLKLALNR